MDALPRTMRAALLRAPGRVELVELPVPALGPGEALVRVRACSICGSDLMDWYVSAKAPFVFGHELAGEIAAVGPGVEGWRPGDRVFVHHHAPCGTCPACARGDDVHCPAWRSSRLDPGGMAEFVRVPAGNLARDTLRLPPALDFEDGALVEPVACAVKALRRAAAVLGALAGQAARRPGGAPAHGVPDWAAPLAGARVLVLGLGFNGQVLGRLARALGAGAVIGSDPVADRRQRAEAWADAVVDPAAGDVAAAARARGGEGADLALVTAPSREALAAGAAAARPGGVVLAYAPTPPGTPLALALHDLFFREVTLVTSYSAGPRDTREALALMAGGVLRVRDLISHRLPLDRADEAYRLAGEPGRSLKVVVLPGTESP